MLQRSPSVEDTLHPKRRVEVRVPHQQRRVRLGDGVVSCPIPLDRDNVAKRGRAVVLVEERGELVPAAEVDERQFFVRRRTVAQEQPRTFRADDNSKERHRLWVGDEGRVQVVEPTQQHRGRAKELGCVAEERHPLVGRRACLGALVEDRVVLEIVGVWRWAGRARGGSRGRERARDGPLHIKAGEQRNHGRIAQRGVHDGVRGRPVEGLAIRAENRRRARRAHKAVVLVAAIQGIQGIQATRAGRGGLRGVAPGDEVEQAADERS